MRRIVLTGLLFTMGAATAAALMTWRAAGDGVAVAGAIVSPHRTAPEPPLIPPPPAVPGHAATLPSVTFVLETTQSGPGGTRRRMQRITRSHDRVQMTLDDQREWLFLQNVVYRDRVTGYLTDHDTREIRFCDDSLLRSMMRIRGWMDVLTIRFDPTVLTTLRETGERRQTVGATFARYVAAESGGDGVLDVWWSDALLLPVSLTTRHAATSVTTILKELTKGADTTSLLTDPTLRFPTYRRLDSADTADH